MSEITEYLLTDEQVDNLLEMCKSVFKEYDDTLMYQIPSKPTEKLRHGKIWFYTHNKEYKTSVHWFELCIGHLFDNMYEDESESNYNWNIFVRSLRFGIHPVDHLYQIFKKNKYVK